MEKYKFSRTLSKKFLAGLSKLMIETLMEEVKPIVFEKYEFDYRDVSILIAFLHLIKVQKRFFPLNSLTQIQKFWLNP